MIPFSFHETLFKGKQEYFNLPHIGLLILMGSMFYQAYDIR